MIFGQNSAYAFRRPQSVFFPWGERQSFRSIQNNRYILMFTFLETIHILVVTFFREDFLVVCWKTVAVIQ